MRAMKFVSKYWLAVFTLLLFAVFSVLTPAFLTTTNFFNIIGSACVMAIAGMGLTCIMTAGEIDFSAGEQVTMGGVVFGTLLNIKGFDSIPLAIVLTVLILCCVGAFNAFLHITVKMPSFIATMGTSHLLLGIAKKLTKGGQVIMNARNWPDGYTVLGQGRVFGMIPNTVFVLAAVSLIIYVYTEKTKWGKYMYAVGSNPKTCDYLGISSNAQKLRGFLLCSAMSAVAGIVMSSMLNSCSANMGSGTMLQSITCLMLGATFIKIGVFNVPGTLLSALMLTALSYGMTMLGAKQSVKDFVQGVILILSVSVVTMIRSGKKVRRVRKANGKNVQTSV